LKLNDNEDFYIISDNVRILNPLATLHTLITSNIEKLGGVIFLNPGVEVSRQENCLWQE
jgi:hypothetical protein